jgi:hypothetical protein
LFLSLTHIVLSNFKKIDYDDDAHDDASREWKLSHTCCPSVWFCYIGFCHAHDAFLHDASTIHDTTTVTTTTTTTPTTAPTTTTTTIATSNSCGWFDNDDDHKRNFLHGYTLDESYSCCPFGCPRACCGFGGS